MKFKFGDRVTFVGLNGRHKYHGIIAVEQSYVENFGIQDDCVGIVFKNHQLVSFEKISEVKQGWRR